MNVLFIAIVIAFVAFAFRSHRKAFFASKVAGRLFDMGLDIKRLDTRATWAYQGLALQEYELPKAQRSPERAALRFYAQLAHEGAVELEKALIPGVSVLKGLQTIRTWKEAGLLQPGVAQEEARKIQGLVLRVVEGSKTLTRSQKDALLGDVLFADQTEGEIAAKMKQTADEAEADYRKDLEAAILKYHDQLDARLKDCQDFFRQLGTREGKQGDHYLAACRLVLAAILVASWEEKQGIKKVWGTLLRNLTLRMEVMSAGPNETARYKLLDETAKVTGDCVKRDYPDLTAIAKHLAREHGPSGADEISAAVQLKGWERNAYIKLKELVAGLKSDVLPGLKLIGEDL